MSAIKQALKLPWRYATLRNLTRKLHRKAITILMYHGVSDEAFPVYNWCHIPRSEFEEQAAFLAQHYKVLPLIEVVNRITKNQPLPDFTACITFDDAFRTILSNAAPILERHQLPSTVFVVTQAAETGQPAWPDHLFATIADTQATSVHMRDEEMRLDTPANRTRTYGRLMRMLRSVPTDQKDAELAELERSLSNGPTSVDDMSPLATMRWAEIEEMAKHELFQFGPHTHTHEDLPACTQEQQYTEISTSHDLMKQHIGYSELFAYPNGRFTDTTKRIVQEVGLRAAVTTEHALNSRSADAFELARVGVGCGLTRTRFEGKILGY